MASTQKVRRLVLTAAVTSITIAGTLYGAGLKTNQEIVEVSKRKMILQTQHTIIFALVKMVLDYISNSDL